MSELLHYGEHEPFHDIVTNDGDVQPLASSTQSEIDDMAVQLGIEYKTTHNSVGSFATRSFVRPFQSGDPTYGQESHVIGSDDGGETPGQLATDEDKARIRRNANAMSVTYLNGLKADLAEMLVQPGYDPYQTALLRKKIEKREKDLAARNALPDDYDRL
ncbi:hypothetical protein A2707_03515 [Candidatus Saccharibacteria bacterium RIFCSPHIGHO2_01_FULL_45_15]|nr:MAG: hypothetical protein A2707_03515 [Candidatus Saccharibacteria bacterium RIFCSPHIGHO2_01_FULL_45_15]OGL32435.1 MAG: hypothetical protein A3E76_00050 [Candidatus Saccharibacteria bacterium RIFCSPHIGHO2_12_FULL_44_22]